MKLEAYDAKYPTYLEWGLQGYREDKSSSTAFEGSWTKIGENYDISDLPASDVFYVRFYLRYGDEDEIEEDHLSYAQAFLSKG